MEEKLFRWERYERDAFWDGDGEVDDSTYNVNLGAEKEGKLGYGDGVTVDFNGEGEVEGGVGVSLLSDCLKVGYGGTRS